MLHECAVTPDCCPKYTSAGKTSCSMEVSKERYFSFCYGIFNEGAYMTLLSIYHKTLNLFKFDCEFKRLLKNECPLSMKQPCVPIERYLLHQHTTS